MRYLKGGAVGGLAVDPCAPTMAKPARPVLSKRSGLILHEGGVELDACYDPGSKLLIEVDPLVPSCLREVHESREEHVRVAQIPARLLRHAVVPDEFGVSVPEPHDFGISAIGTTGGGRASQEALRRRSVWGRPIAGQVDVSANLLSP